eukprot:1340832-Pyramimonas_sp.AAC.1
MRWSRGWRGRRGGRRWRVWWRWASRGCNVGRKGSLVVIPPTEPLISLPSPVPWSAALARGG